MKRIILVTTFLLLFSTTNVSAQDGYHIDWDTMGAGGDVSSGGPCTLDDPMSQPAAGALAGGEFSLDGGFRQCETASVASSGIGIDSGRVQLSWTSSQTNFNVYRAANDPYFNPAEPYASVSSSPWLDPDINALGNVAVNHTYLIRVDGDCGESPNSRRMGGFDFALCPAVDGTNRRNLVLFNSIFLDVPHDPNYDMNGDGIIDIADIFAVATRIGDSGLS